MATKKVNGLTFQQWLCEIDAILVTYIGLSANDGADWSSFDTWESGCSPGDAIEVWLAWQDDPDMLGELLADYYRSTPGH